MTTSKRNGKVWTSKDGRFVVEVTAGRRDSAHTVWFADGSRGTAATRFWSLFSVGDNGVSQIGNYRSLEAAVDAAVLARRSIAVA